VRPVRPRGHVTTSAKYVEQLDEVYSLCEHHLLPVIGH
jgi:GTP cyclohydrolase I